ncbi:hypothetical protein ACIBCT_13160 [Streptosporangium sp. NPDC050855]|uniref:hypothetical protein n=1 Tax=Streptosporangium sp. NPDC050855 TaxID=3366194 RepID=UPI003794723E
MGIGRILYLTFGSLMLIFALMWTFDDDEPANMQRAQVFALGSIGLMVAGAACGAAERRTTYVPPAVPRPPVQQPPAPQPPVHQAPAQQPYPPQGHDLWQGHDPWQGHAAPQPYDPRQGHTLPHPPGRNH